MNSKVQLLRAFINIGSSYEINGLFKFSIKLFEEISFKEISFVEIIDCWLTQIGKQFFCRFAPDLMLILISTLIGQQEYYSAICSGPDKTLLDYSQLWSGPVKRTIIFIQVLTWAYPLNSKPFSRFGKVHIESKEYVYQGLIQLILCILSLIFNFNF